MSNRYNSSEVEVKWQKRWRDDTLYRVDFGTAKNKGAGSYYNLVMFPYPSGDKLHVGHWYNFGPADSWGRYMRMKGYKVFEPMGFDAFGLPAENYAIKTGIHPDESIAANTATMQEQLSRIGTMYDWDKMVNTSKPDYYKWTQWLFLKMYKHGLAYKKEALVNWCENCQTVLANEQAQDGTCERCGTEVVKKPLEQWFWKITAYSQRLLDGLEKIDWPEKTKLMQKNWIGRKEGINITYKVKGSDKSVTVFTTRPETNFGATFVVIAPEHALVPEITTAEHKAAVEAYVEEAGRTKDFERTREDRKKTGVFTGSYAVNQLTGYEMPIYVADYVLVHYGTGVVVGVPGHDVRDFEFAEAFDIEIIRVIEGPDGDASPITSLQQVQEDAGVIMGSDFLNGLAPHDAIPKMMDHLEEKGYGERVISYRLRDWLISRQRYWGAPIPIVYDPDGKAHPVPEEHLPWVLPTDVEFKPTGTAPLAQSEELASRTEKIFGKGWRPEVDTMDTFVCSSFYFLRYLMGEHPQKDDLFIDPEIEKEWMPVDMYIGGPEHACMHLIYARFVMMALYDWGVVSHEEPFQKLVHQGLITKDGAKMSKSKGNVVSPDEFVSKYGSDVFRMYLMFMGPFTDGGDWSDKGITGISRFVDRLFAFMQDDAPCQDEKEADRLLHQTIQRVTDDIEKMQFNTVLAALMELLNAAVKIGFPQEQKRTLTLLVAPLAPHLAEELWEMLGGTASIFQEKWPTYNPALLVQDQLTIAVQVNGKLRAQIEIAADATEDAVYEAVLVQDNVKKYTEGNTLIKKIYVPGKLVNLVVK